MLANLRLGLQILGSIMIFALFLQFLLVGASPVTPTKYSEELLTELSEISKHWGQLSPYHDNPDDRFGVQDIGLPDGCGIEQVHELQRHAQRFPTSMYDDGGNNENFAAKLGNFTNEHKQARFTGPLEFLNGYEYLMEEGLLTGLGASTEFNLGVKFWNNYGRLLYNAGRGQLAFDPKQSKKKPVIRTTGQARIENSQISWSLGFFGPSYKKEADTSLKSVAEGPDRVFNTVIIPEGLKGGENNTLASYDSCPQALENDVGMIGDQYLIKYLPKYLNQATARMQKYAPAGFKFTVNDTYAMQSICAYENAYIGSSEFCNLFTADEWAGFESSLDIEYYYDYAYGNPTGRAQGLGYIQELVARLTKQYITASNSSVNHTITNNPEQFPLDQPFYVDFSHDDILISVLTGMSVDYYRDAPSLSAYPPKADRRFILADITPFGAHLTTEVIGCKAEKPDSVKGRKTVYRQGQNGYDEGNAPFKFIRMRLNNGIVPLASIRTGECKERSDGLCAMSGFLKSLENAEGTAKYAKACFSNYTIGVKEWGKDYDGTV